MINFPFIPNGKLIILSVPKFGQITALIILGLHTGTPKTINFPFGTNGKSMILSVPIIKHFRVIHHSGPSCSKHG